MVNTSPSISLDVTSAEVSSTTPLDITYTVTEPEGTPTTVAITDGIPDSAVTITHTTSNNHVRAVFDGSTPLTANTITFTATDGVNTGVATCTINVSYFSGVFAMWADGTVIKAYSGASVKALLFPQRLNFQKTSGPSTAARTKFAYMFDIRTIKPTAIILLILIIYFLQI